MPESVKSSRLRNTFSKQERLKSKKLIGELFEKGRSIDARPLKMIWMQADEAGDYPALASFSVSKKNFPRAVDRNRIKRLMREAYRLQKADFYQRLNEKKARFIFMLIFTGRKIPVYGEVFEKVGVVLDGIVKAL